MKYNPELAALLADLDSLWREAPKEELGSLETTGDHKRARMKGTGSEWATMRLEVDTDDCDSNAALAGADFIRRFWNAWPMLRELLDPMTPQPDTELNKALREVMNRFGVDASTGIADYILADVLEHQARLAGGLHRATEDFREGSY